MACFHVSASTLPDNFAELPADVQALLLEYAFFDERVSRHWGPQANPARATAYVKYLDDYLSRARIDFEAGTLVVETLASGEPKKQLSEAIISALLTPDDPNAVDIYSAQDIKASSEPFLLGRVLDGEGQAIKFRWRAQQFAQQLLAEKLRIIESPQGWLYRVTIPLVGNHQQVAAKGIQAWVSAASTRFNLPRSLILAIIETESGFNPFAVSPTNAYGLMQIIPSTAGKDVFQKIYQRKGQPSRQYLFDARQNINTGSAYLSLLRDRYLRGIKHPTSQLYCIISAYNSGAGNVLKAFHSHRGKAIERINSLSVEDVLWRLRKKNPSLEGRRYLEKVLRNQQKHRA